MGLVIEGLLEVKMLLLFFFLLSEVDKRCVWLCVVAGGVGGYGGGVCVGEIRIVKSDSESSSFVKKLVAELDGVPSSLVSFAPRCSPVEEKFKRCPQP